MGLLGSASKGYIKKKKVDLVQKCKINVYSLPPAESNYCFSGRLFNCIQNHEV